MAPFSIILVGEFCVTIYNKTSRQRLPDDGNAVACLCRFRLFIRWARKAPQHAPCKTNPKITCHTHLPSVAFCRG